MRLVKSALISIFPFYLLISVLSVLFKIITISIFIQLTLSTLLFVLGMILFIPGVSSSIDNAIPLLSTTILSKNNKYLIFLFSFILCFFATISEPNLHIFTNQFISIMPFVNRTLFLLVGSFSLSIFLILSIIRLYLHLNIRIVFLVLYSIFLVISLFLSPSSMSITMDSAGGATGLLTVPLITVLGVSVANSIQLKNNSDKFGFVSISAMGVLISVGIFMLFLPKNVNIINSQSVDISVLENFLNILKSTSITIVPFIAIYLFIFIFFVKLRGYVLRSKIFGVLFLSLSLLLILSSTTPVYIPQVQHIATSCANKGFLTTVFVAMIFGFLTAFLEPSILVLSESIEKEFQGKIKKNLIVISIAIGLSLAMMLCVLFLYKEVNIKIFFFILYLLILVLMFLTDDIFVGISFDAGAGGAGTMSGIILLPFVTKIAEIYRGSALFGFGAVGVVVAIPILLCEIIGIVYKLKIKGAKR